MKQKQSSKKGFLSFISKKIHSKHRKNTGQSVDVKKNTFSPLDEHAKTLQKIDTLMQTLDQHQDTLPPDHIQHPSNKIVKDIPSSVTSSASSPVQMNASDLMNSSFPQNENLDEDSEMFDQSYNETTSSSITVSKPKKPEKSRKKQRKWLYSGIKGFDDLLEKGIPTRSNIIVAGGPGCGKTIFCLQTVYNLAANGDDCVFLSMEERPDRLKEHMMEFGFQIEEIKRNEEQIILRANGKGRISLKRIQPIRLARSIEALLEKASGTLPVDIDLVLDFIPEEFDTTLLTLDSISAIETAFSGTKRQYRIYIEQLFRYFEELKLTTFMITESSEAPQRFSTTGVEEFLADGIIVFYNFQGVKQRTRGAEIFKLRGAAHSQKIVPIQITTDGIVFLSDQSPRDTLIG